MREYTDEELFVRVLDKEAIKKVMSRRAYYLANHWRQKELDELWVQSEELKNQASFGGNWGYYLSMDEISRWYVHEYEEQLLRESTNGERGKGVSVFHPIGSPLIRLAGDGQSARALFYSIGEESRVAEDGKAVGYWINEKLAADFIKEDGRWRILHLVESCDFTHRCGENFADQKLFPNREEDISRVRFGNPTIKMLVHDPMYNWEDNYPYVPGDYEHFGDNGSFGPMDHPGYRRQV